MTQLELLEAEDPRPAAAAASRYAAALPMPPSPITIASYVPSSAATIADDRDSPRCLSSISGRPDPARSPPDRPGRPRPRGARRRPGPGARRRRAVGQPLPAARLGYDAACRRSSTWTRTARTTGRPAGTCRSGRTSRSTATPTAGSTSAAPAPPAASPSTSTRRPRPRTATTRRVARGAAVVHRRGRDVGPVVRRLHLDPGRGDAPAARSGRSCPIQATDDRYTDDVHYVGGAMTVSELAQYAVSQVAMNALPACPRAWGDDWLDALARAARCDAGLAVRVGAAAARRCCTGGSGRLRPDYEPDRGRGPAHHRLDGRVRRRGAPDAGALHGRRRQSDDRRAVGPRAAAPRLPGPEHRLAARGRPLVRSLAQGRARTARTRSRRSRGSTATRPPGAVSQAAQRVSGGPPAAWGRGQPATLSATTSAARFRARLPPSCPRARPPPRRPLLRSTAPTAGLAAARCAGARATRRTASPGPPARGGSGRRTRPTRWSHVDVLGFPVAVAPPRLDPAGRPPRRPARVRAPDGAVERVSEGILNLTHRDSHAQPTPLEPDGATRSVQLVLPATDFPPGTGSRSSSRAPTGPSSGLRRARAGSRSIGARPRPRGWGAARSRPRRGCRPRLSGRTRRPPPYRHGGLGAALWDSGEDQASGTVTTRTYEGATSLPDGGPPSTSTESA